MRTLTVVLLVGLTLPLAACGDESGGSAGGAGGGSGGAGPLQGRTFQSVTATEDGKPKALAPKTRIRLQFMADGRLIADAGCNSMQGLVSTSNGKVAVQELSMTDMGCDAARHAQDDWLARVLGAKPAWRLDADQLHLVAGETTLVLRDRAATEPPVRLEGVRWVVDSLIDGETASHPVGVEKAQLTFDSQRVSGNTGCNEFSGPVERDGNKLTIGNIVQTMKACQDPSGAVEKAVLDTLRGRISYQLDGERLSLRREDGSGLDLVRK